MATHLNKDVHDIHPSLANLTGTIGLAKNRLSQAATIQDYKVKRVDTADNLKSGALRPFGNSGERNFLILIDNIELFNDKELSEQTTHITLEKDAIVSGTYLYNDNNVVSIGNPYNVYCKSLNVEPQDLIHSEYIENENNNIDSNEQDDYIVINTNTETDITQNEKDKSEINNNNCKPYDPQKMDENDTEDKNDTEYDDPNITDTILISHK